MSGPVGTPVMVTGTNLGSVTSVQFGSIVAANFTINGDGTTLWTRVPVGAVTGRIYVLSAEGNAASANNFTVTAALPTLGLVATVANEGSAAAPGFAEVKVTLSAPSTQTVTVRYYTTDNSAKAASDYLAINGTLTFSPGQTLKKVRVNFVGDNVAEKNEVFYLDLRSPTNATLSSSRGSIYIRNDDGPSITINNAITVNEGNAGSRPQNFMVRLSAASSDTVMVSYATANATAGPNDYVVAQGTLIFAPGETSKTITIQVRGDTVVEPTETYRVNLLRPSFAIITDSQGVGYIRNDDVSPLLFESAAPSQ